MSPRLPAFLGLALLIAFVLLLQPHVRLAGARDGPWTRAGADPRQEHTPAPSATPPAASSQTPSATPSGTVTPDTGPHYLDLSLDPNPAHEWQLVTARVTARDMGMDSMRLDLRRRYCTADCTRNRGRRLVRTLSTDLTFLAPAIGTWEVSASACGEAFECRGGQCGWEIYACGSTEYPVALTVEGSTRYLPVLVRPEGSGYTPTPTSTVAATPTATVTPMPSPTPIATATVARSPTATDEPSIAVVSGRVALGEEGGPGLPGVSVNLWMGGPYGSFMTDEEGRYHSGEMQLHNEQLHLSPFKPGYIFEPDGAGFWHRGWPGRYVYGIEFVAFPATATPTATQTATPVPSDVVMAVAVDAKTGEKWFGTDGGAGRLLADGSWRTFGTAEGLASDHVRAIAIDAATGDRWFGTDRGVSRLGTDGRWESFAVVDGLANDDVTALAVHPGSGDIWFGSRAGASRLSPDGHWRTYTTAGCLRGNDVRALAPDPANGDCWIGTDFGVTIVSGVSTCRTITTADGLGSNSVTAVAIDAVAGEQWVATSNGTVTVFQRNGRLRMTVNTARAITIDPLTGDKWFATDWGVERIPGPGASGQQKFTTKDGLAHDVVLAIAIDLATGDKWFGTRAGVSRLGTDGRWATLHVPPPQGGR